MRESILITGGLGYVGGRLASHLCKSRPDLDIIIATRRAPEDRPEWSGGFSVRRMDLLDRSSIKSCVDGVDMIVHLATMNEIDSMEDPLRAMDVNIRAAYDLLNVSSSAGVKKFVYLSTFHVYGAFHGERIAENSPTRPSHPYAITHRAAEGLVDYFRGYKKLNTLILRLSNGYGCPMDLGVNRWSLAFNDLCRQVVNDGKIILRSSGRQHRDFISLEDISRAIDHFLFTAPDAWDDGLFNLGGECSMSILDVANRVSSAYQKLYDVDHIPIETGPPESNSDKANPVDFSIDKLKSTGFSLVGDMEREIKRTLKLINESSHDR